MTLDEIEKMCDEEVADPVTGTHQRDYRGAMRGHHLARALLKVLPVVRLADKWRDVEAKVNSTHWTGADCELMDAIDAMRTALKDSP